MRLSVTARDGPPTKPAYLGSNSQRKPVVNEHYLLDSLCLRVEAALRTSQLSTLDPIAYELIGSNMRLVPEEISFSGSLDTTPIYNSHAKHEYQII